MRVIRSSGMVVAVCAVVSLGGVTTSSAAAAKRVQPSTQAQVKKLSKQLRGARTPAARYRALTDVMRAVGIGVVTRSGKPIVLARESRAARGFQLYDFELRALASALARGSTVDLSGLAGRLTTMGFGLAEDRPMPPEFLRDALGDAARGAKRKPKRSDSLLLLLVRDLGLRRSTGAYDIARSQAPDKYALDALQAFLLTADIAIPILRRTVAAAPAAPRALAASFGIARAAQGPSGTCADFERALEDLSGSALGRVNEAIPRIGVTGRAVILQGLKKAKWSIRDLPSWAAKGVFRGAKAAARAAVILEGLHGAILSYSINVRALDDRLAPTHYGHRAPGTELRFRIQVEMLDDFGETIVKCGKLLGFEFPPKGPIEGVQIDWEDAEGNLAKHGKVICEATCLKTGKDGIATRVFQPRVEFVVGQGLEREDSGVVSGVARYLSRFNGGEIAKAAELVPKFGSTRWFVRFHEEPKLELRFNSVATVKREGSTVSQDHGVTMQAVVPLVGGPLGEDYSRGQYTGVGSFDHLSAFGYDEGRASCRIDDGHDDHTHSGTIVQGSDYKPETATSSTFTVRDLSVVPTPDGGYDLELYYRPGRPTVDVYSYIKSVTPGCSTYPPYTHKATPFQEAYIIGHFAEFTDGSGDELRAVGWQPGTGSVIARKDYDNNNDGYADKTAIELVALPPAPPGG